MRVRPYCGEQSVDKQNNRQTTVTLATFVPRVNKRARAGIAASPHKNIVHLPLLVNSYWFAGTVVVCCPDPTHIPWGKGVWWLTTLFLVLWAGLHEHYIIHSTETHRHSDWFGSYNGINRTENSASKFLWLLIVTWYWVKLVSDWDVQIPFPGPRNVS